MHRWFYANEEIKCEKTPPSTPPTPATPVRTPSPELVPDTLWKFTVKYWGKRCSNEYLAVSGSIEHLGNWSVENCVLLQLDATGTMWTVKILLPRNDDIRFRYLVCATTDSGRKIIRFWETHDKARWIRCNDKQTAFDYDIFGEIKKAKKVQRGWVMPNSNVVQLKFYHSPFELKEYRIATLLYIKVSPLLVEAQQASIPSESEAEQNEEENLESNYAFCEVSSLQDEHHEFRYQPKYGTPCGPSDMVMFHLTLGNIKRTAYLINLYSYPAKAGADIPPYHIGYQYIYPQQIKNTLGSLRLNVMCATKHRCIGTMTCEYLVIKPLPEHTFDLMESLRVPKRKIGSKPLQIGHRGCGLSYWLEDSVLRENTIKSFNTAYDHGADMVEFDVQLTRENIPIIYHDFMMYISKSAELDKFLYDILKLKLNEMEINKIKAYGRLLKIHGREIIVMPTNQFTLEQLQHIDIGETKIKLSLSSPCLKDDIDDFPFPTLEYALKKLPKKLGFNVEIKYSQQLVTGEWEEHYKPDFDKNEYVDIILDVILKYASSRQIVFSSFDADICTLVRLKQNRFPVAFLCNSSTCTKKYLDPRGDSLLSSVYFAAAMELYGIVPDCMDIHQMSGEISGIHRHNLVVFVWGAPSTKEEFRKELQNRGVDGIIYDRINHALAPKTLFHSVYLLELRDKKGDSEDDEIMPHQL